MPYNLLMHMDTEDSALLELTIGNITNYLAALSKEKHDVRLVANADAVKLFTKNCPKSQELRNLCAKGLIIDLCANALRKHNLNKADLLDCCSIVPAGVVEIVRLQNDGFAYVKP